MCIGVPMQVISVEGFTAVCAGRDGAQVIDVGLTSGVQPGEWVMAFLGSAREVISAEAARVTLDALEALELAMRGEANVDHLFADLIGREPTLPDHLKPEHKDA
ncbi:MAG: HypC/HybG/HupF family hydrogenase formation chaperone [Hyphomicrobiaceae bacterium]|nr:HypC/HybG/HupF family hydrogenase formation chaperone [Hyphomicrobiaceae bacterium]